MKHLRRLFALSSVILLFGLVGWNSALSQNCTHEVKLYDDFGDGWDIASLTVYVNGTAVLTNITLFTGVGPATFAFQAGTGDVISTSYSPGIWAYENSYYIHDGAGAVIASDGVGGWTPSGLSGISANCPPMPSQCEFQITMMDDYGDGWNGGYLMIYLNGVLTYSNITLPSGAGPGMYTFMVGHGDVVTVTFVAGSWASECSYSIKQGGVVVFTDGAFGSTPTANDSFVGIGNCPSDVVVEEVIIDYADGYWARREAPDGNAVRAAMTVLSGPELSTMIAVYKVGSPPTSATDGVFEVFSLTWNSGVTEIEFTQRLDALAIGAHTVYVAAYPAADPDFSNNVNSGTEYAESYKVKGVEGFDDFDVPGFNYRTYFDMGWTTLDLNGGAGWETSFTGAGYVIQHPGGEAADDWLFTPSAILDQNASYRLRGGMRTSGSGPKVVELAYGPAPDPSQMTVFATFVDFNNTDFMEFKDIAGSLFDPYFNTVSGPVPMYVGVHVSSASGDQEAISYLLLDNNPTPPPVIGYAWPGSPLDAYIDDPSIPIGINATYKAPGKINRTFSVTNTTGLYGTNGDFLWDVETVTPWIAVQKAPADPTLQGWNFSPERPRQYQTFTLTVDPAGLAAGVHTGYITFYGILFTDEFPPPASGLVAINEPFIVPVELWITNAGGKSGPVSFCFTQSTPMTPGNTYVFADVATGNPIADVEVVNGQIDDMTVCVFPNQLPLNLARMRYVMRYWQITATGQMWMANITFPYANHETAMVFDLFQLRGVRQASPPGAWEDPIISTSSVSDPMNNNVMVHGVSESNYMGNIALAHPYFIERETGKLPANAPLVYGLDQNYPNPFNPGTTISYSVPEDASVRLTVYNYLGMEVAVLVDRIMPAGRHSVDFDASELSTGMYIYRLTAGEFTQIRQMILSK